MGIIMQCELKIITPVHIEISHAWSKYNLFQVVLNFPQQRAGYPLVVEK
jgi:hypothetical protein